MKVMNYLKNTLEGTLLCKHLLYFLLVLQLTIPKLIFSQNLTIAPVDTSGSVGINCIIRIDNNDEPHILYYDLLNYQLKHAHYENGLWSLYETGINNQIDDFKIDSFNNLHCTKANYSYLEYYFLGNDTAYTEIVDSTDGRYADSDIDFDLNIPKIVCLQYMNPEYLYEFSRSQTGWNRTEVCSLPQYPTSVSFLIKNEISHAICFGAADKILLYLNWDAYSLVVDTVVVDSIYSVNSMDISDYNTPWILYNKDYYSNYNLVMTTKYSGAWIYETIDSLSGSVDDYHIRCSVIDDTQYAIFITTGLPPKTLKLGYKIDDSWIFEDLYSGDLRGCSFDIASDGNIHFCFNLYENGNYNLYYGCWDRITGLDDNLRDYVDTLSVYLYPNPVTSCRAISIGGKITEGEYFYEIYDLLGRKILGGYSDAYRVGGNITLEINGATFNELGSGLYFISINSREFSKCKKILIVK